jgi:hypothetical protein
VEEGVKFEVLEEFVLRLEGFEAVNVACVHCLAIINSGDLRVETATIAAAEGILLVALVAEVMMAGGGDHAYVDGVVADGADLGLAGSALWVQLSEETLTRTVVSSKKVTSSS